MSHRIEVRHGDRRYHVEFVHLEGIASALPRRAVIVTDANVRNAWPNAFPAHPTLVVPPGEASKSPAEFVRLLERLADSGVDRSTAVVAFGGGVVGDLAGFAAAAFMRGVPLIQVPTSLLAMVDSSVGGKVGIDLAAGKNLAGAFWPPETVYVPVETLATLPPRHCTNGLAEVWKYAYILDPALRSAIAAGQGLEAETIARCIELKAQVVAEDPYERSGRRAILNFGHTVGHAIEQITGYGPVLHGEAIAIGMVVETRLATALGIAPAGLLDLIETDLATSGLPTRLDPAWSSDDLLLAMRRDKKATEGRLAFSLVPNLGECKLVKDVPPSAIAEALRNS